MSDFENPWVTIPKQIQAKLLKFHQKIMYLTAILDPRFWILTFWRQIHNQRPQKPPSKSFQTDLSTFNAFF